MNAAGLFLWSVSVSTAPQKLWITTRRNKLGDAVVKAEKFLASSGGQYGLAKIREVASHGFIDA